ncbi:protein Fe65 homolog [Watersipora subatra]|uniref:protein Fe65 homolog n=1 Tax=Watersipora subatra TaxID=2589382 RepID=UPI00355B3BE7
MSAAEEETGMLSQDNQRTTDETEARLTSSVDSPINSSEYEEISLITSGSDSGMEEAYITTDIPVGVHSPRMVSPVIDNPNSPAKSMQLNTSEDIYAVIDKTRKSPEKLPPKEKSEEEQLPLGWKKCFDDEGEYYWHVRTGSIQRDRPADEAGDSAEVSSPADHLKSMESSLINLADKTIKSMSLNGADSMTSGPEQTLRFSVHSIGWTPLSEADLQDQETSCRSINRCIMDLTGGKTNDGMAQWAEGKELRMEIDGKELCLLDPVSTTVLSVQPIHTIRVWGVGSQNSCDFAYVARDPMTRIHNCHVFRCEVPAKQIANTLKEICSRLAKERKEKSPGSSKKRPEKLDALHLVAEKGKVVLPSPMNAASKTKKCHYIGSMPVDKATGMDIVNGAIESLTNSVDRGDWLFSNVAVSSADIRVTGVQYETVILDTRLRFLTFFGISARDVRLMGMIVHTAEDEFVAHVFHCEPSAGALCKVIEAACKLRYQKLLDSMPDKNLPVNRPSPSTTGNKTIQGTVMSVLQKVWPVKKS